MDMLSLNEASPAPAPTSAAFDYDALPQALADKQRQRAARIAGIYRRTVEAAGEIGRELLAAQEELEHGTFLRWVEDGLGLSKSSAYRFMDVARSFGEKLPTVGNLPMTLVHKLAERSTPEPVRAAVLRRIEAGEAIKADEVLGEINEAKDKARKRAAADREDVRRAALSLEQREQEDLLRSRSEKGRAARARKEEREREERERQYKEERAQRAHEASAAAAILLAGIGADTAVSFCERYSRLSHDVFQRLGDLANTERARNIEPTDMRRTEIDQVGFIGMGRAYWDDCQEVEALAEDIRQNGLKEPISVVKHVAPEKFGRHRIVDGSRRFRAVSVVLGWETVPVRIAPPTEPLADG